MLEPAAVKKFYDHFGARQDRQGFYEDRALDDLFSEAAFGEAQTIVEFGCGTGRFARRILTTHSGVSYLGFDISTKMVQLAQNTVESFGTRASVREIPAGSVELPIAQRSADRIVSTYVLDLLPGTDIETFFQQGQRVLRPGGRLCLVSLTGGTSIVPRFVSSVWRLLFRLRPELVGGCRPITLLQFCDEARWEILHHRIIVAWGISSEILVARTRAA